MPANMISAPVGSSFTVSGRSIATVSAGPTPGSTPTNVPIVTPMKPQSRLIGVSATPNPVASDASVSIGSGPRRAEERCEPPAGQTDVQELHEEQERPERERETDREVPDEPGATEAARHAREQDRAGDDETGRADQDHVGEEPRGHPEKRR